MKSLIDLRLPVVAKHLQGSWSSRCTRVRLAADPQRVRRHHHHQRRGRGF